MRVCYQKLWRLFAETDLKKNAYSLAGISAVSITKIGKGGNVNTMIITTYTQS